MQAIRSPFGHFVRQHAGISDQRVEECLASQRLKGGRLGEIFAEKGLLSQRQVLEILGLQARSVAAAENADADAPRFPFATFFSLCMPAYNEEANIESTLDSACAILPELVQRFEVVVANDGSKDRTGEVVARYAARDARVRLVNLDKNLGYGGAVRSALRAAQGDLVAFTDSDGQFSLLDLPNLLRFSHSNDVVVGYRHPRADPWYRSINAYAWNRLIRLLFGVRVRDLDCAFKLFHRQVLENIEMISNGAAINAEILAQVFRDRLKIKQVPVRHFPRYHGAPTGAGLKVIMKAFKELPQLWKYRTRSTLLRANNKRVLKRV
jgi:glycosyltransferase involved in cell wall biosynthesis